MGEIVWLCRYPVKSLLGEARPAVEVTGAGVVGDRRYALVDQATGLVASAKNPARWGGLLRLSARFVAADSVEVRLPGERIVRASDTGVHRALSDVVGRAVTLESTRPAGASLERLTPETEEGAGTLTRGTGVPGLGPRTCVGAYASVVAPGQLRVGDRVRLT